MTITPTPPASQALVPWAGCNEPALTEVVVPIKEPHPWLTWMTGNLPTVDHQEVPIGWHVHRGVNPPLDELLARLGYKTRTIEHDSPSGDSEAVEYWSLSTRWDPAQHVWVTVPCSLFLIARGVRDKWEMGDNPQLRDGVAYGWEVVRNKNGVVYKPDGTPKKQPKVKFRAFVQELLQVSETGELSGFTEWFQASMGGYLVDDMLHVFSSQYRALAASNKALRAEGINEPTPFWALSLPTMPAETARRVTSKEGQSKSILPMRSAIPVEAAITREYLDRHRIPHALAQRLVGREEGILLETWAWSIEETEYLLGLKERKTSVANEDEGEIAPANVVDAGPASAPPPTPQPARTSQPAPAPHPGLHRPPAPADDPYISVQQVQILQTLCPQPDLLQRWCSGEPYQVPEPSWLRVSQFLDLMQRLSRPQTPER